MKPLISLSTAALLLVLAAFGVTHLAAKAPEAGGFLPGAGFALYAAAVLLLILHGINRLAEWRHEIRKRLDPNHPDYQP